MTADARRPFHWWPFPFAVIPLLLFFGFPLWFSPGWANDWPLGITIYAVWSAFMATVFSVMVLSFWVGSGAAISYVLVDRVGLEATRAGFLVWVGVGVALAVGLGFVVYQDSYAETLQMWPNGYGA